ncbi:uncharacterized protein LOC126995543 [Eriocheir sinensis]|uniref:uncharacterized protein LOC126995543 n=1 Tax=Eriocheir sinensis TaxID=95602 RepID=UPI0021C802F4|nr:uncharacterized protein LOC126995543 [Eriocheir sinensis]XP_050711136.1 uncharacterized protein LOC126995543 [Eriocheir sinensis]
MEITALKEIIVHTLGALVVGVCTVLMLPDFWYSVAFARTLAKAVQEWQDSGPHNTLLGKAREHLAAAGWLAAPRDPLVECGLPSGSGWKQLLQLMLHTEASLTCMERQVLLAQEEHLAFRDTVLLAVACFTLTVSLLGWTWARHKLVRRSHQPSKHRKDDNLFSGGEGEAPSYEGAAAKQSDGAEEASECAGQGQVEVSQVEGKEEISAQKEDEGVLPQQQEEVIPQQEIQKFQSAQEAAGLEALPEQEEAVHQQEEAVPQQEEAVPQQEEADPQQEALPEQEEAVHQQEEAVPQQEEAVPQQEEADPQQEEADPQQEEADPQQEALPKQGEAQPPTEAPKKTNDNDTMETQKGAPLETPDGGPKAAQHVSPLPLPRLRSPDRRDILGKRWLSDDVMDLAQELLQRQFPNTGGLYACGAAFTLPPLQPGNAALFLQVVNRTTPMSLASMADYGRAGGSHWLLLSSYGAGRPGQLAVYDSLYDTLSPSTAALVRQLQELHAPPPGVVVRPVQRQRDGYSCGLFALAFAFSIAHGQDPCRLHYVRARMASHLLSCLERGTVTPFPSEPKETFG